jgi:hypothetical protein
VAVARTKAQCDNRMHNCNARCENRAAEKHGKGMT